MDPQITWHSMLAAWTRGEWLEVIELAEALLEWLDKDGFPPKTVAVPELGTDWHRVVAGATAKFALAHAAAVLEHPDGVPTIVAFTLTCAHCNNEGPTTYTIAKREGWKGIQYSPTEMSENFLGVCPTCQRDDDE